MKNYPRQQLADLRDLFASPPRDFSPTPLWWWSAAKVTKDGIVSQLRQLATGGVYNVVVINLAPAGPLFGADADDPAWFSDEWFERFDDMCDAAEQLGMRVWFYDQIGFSGANIQGRLTQEHPWAAGKMLASTETELRASEIPDDRIAVDRVVGVYSLPTDADPHGRRLTWSGRHVDGVADNARVKVVTWTRSSYDYLDPKAVALLIDLVHGEFERRMPQRLGKVIAGSFQDELPATNAWTDSFPETFAASYGYDLLDHLPALFAPSGETGAKILHDYYEHRAALTEDALFRPLGEWHEERGMLLGADQSNPARAGWPNQSTQLYSDYFRTHRHYSAAGSDHQGDSKVHSSMAHLYGHPRVWLEAFHSTGWGGTLGDTYDWLLPFLRSGANLYNPHAVYYSMGGGWFDWAAPSTDWRQPYWGQYKLFADCIARISSIMSWGSHACSVAVLYPSATSMSSLPLSLPIRHFGDGITGSPAADAAQSTFLALCGTNDWWEGQPGLLNSASIDFDVIDDHSLQSAAITHESLEVADERYTAVIVPSVSALLTDTAAVLLKLLEAGGRVLLIGTEPTMSGGVRAADADLAALMSHPRLERMEDPEKAVATLHSLRVLEAELPSLVRVSEEIGVALVPAQHPNATVTSERHPADLDVDPNRYLHSMPVTLPEGALWAEAWNPATGDQKALNVRPGTDDAQRRTVDVPFDGAPAILLVWGADLNDATARRAQPAHTTQSIDLSEGWSAEVVHTLDNSTGDFARPAAAGTIHPAIWKLRVGESVDGLPPLAWESTRATFGVHGVIGGSSASETLWRYSDSRGIEKDPRHRGWFGPKGRIPETFVLTPAPHGGDVVTYRTLVRLPAPGEYELIIGAPASKRVWLDGALVGENLDGDDGYILSLTVATASDTVELSYELRSADVGSTFFAPGEAREIGSFFTFARPGDWPSYPEHVTPRVRERDSGGIVSFQRTVRIEEAVERARLTFGAAWPAAVFVDDVLIGRQEFVEWYGAETGTAPQYFGHDLTAALTPGEHLIELRVEAPTMDVVMYADLLVEYADTQLSVVSDSGWTAQGMHGTTETTPIHRGWGETRNLQLASRPHPLARAEWLGGPPRLGRSVVETLATDSAEERTQWLRLTLPAGVSEIEIPTRVELTASVDGVDLNLDDTPTGYRASLHPTTAPTELQLVTAPTAFFRGGAALDGPVQLTLQRAPIELGAWSDLGLDWLSGGVRYIRSLIIDESPESATLDLGSVRGHVSVQVNGQHVGDLFCPPWTLDVTDALRCGESELQVEVFNTLGPYLDDVSPTHMVYPSQKQDGIFGPVTLSIRPSGHGEETSE